MRVRYPHAASVLASILLAACQQSSVAMHTAGSRAPTPSPSATEVFPTPPAAPLSPSPASREPVHFDAIAFRTPTEGWAAWLDYNLPQPWPVRVAHTTDGGHTWGPAAAVSVYGSGGALARLAIRFADARHGWLYGQGIWSTSDGGRTWHDEGVPGPVQSLEPAGGTVWAVVGCDGAALSCVPTIRVSLGPGRRWGTLPRQPDLDQGPATMVRLSRDHVLVAQGILPGGLGGNAAMFETIDGGSEWTRRALPCGAFEEPPAIATLDGKLLWLVCGEQPGAGNQIKEAYLSRDGGQHWLLEARLARAGDRQPGYGRLRRNAALG